MFESSSASIIRSSWWPRGGMVDTMDLKSMPFWEYQFKSGRGYQCKGRKGLKFFYVCKCKGLDFFCVYFFGIVAIKSQCVGLVRQTKKFLLVMEGLL